MPVCLSSSRLLLCLAALALLTSIASARQAADRLADRFAELDKNADGVITPEELPRQRVFAHFDADSDGRITLAEARQQAGGLREQLGQREPQSSGEGEPSNLSVRMDVPYTAAADDPKLQLDIYASQTPSEAPRPMLVMIHGGGWAIGDKASRGVVHPKAEWFIAQGFTFVSINYRLSPDVVHPVHTQDCADAIAWLYENAEEFGADRDRIAVMGHSAGAHLAALVSTDERYLGKHELPLSTIKATILLDGAGYDIPKTLDGPGSLVMRRMYTTAFGEDPEVWADASPVNHVTSGKGIGPFLLLHAGRREESAQRSKELAEELKSAGVPAVVSHQPDKTHASINADLGIEGDPVTLAVRDFFKAHFE